MPGGDGTGPRGFGPMTGRKAGYCAGFPVAGYANPIPNRSFYYRFNGDYDRDLHYERFARGFRRGFYR